jgi:predicted transcriptional regulator of viral defense system
MSTKRQTNGLSTEAFLTEHLVFSLQELAMAIRVSRSTALERVKHHLARGRLKRVAKEVYVAVPPGVAAEEFFPDRYLVAAAARPHGILSHHAALELLGVAHSEWSECTVLCQTRRTPIALDGVQVRFLVHPATLRRRGEEWIGCRNTERMGRQIAHTGPERTLVDGFSRPELVGGLEELVESAAGFGVLDLALTERILEAFGQRSLWACVGWFLERHQEHFFVPDKFLYRLELERPRSAQYVPRGYRGGIFHRRWNLVLPESLAEDWEGT